MKMQVDGALIGGTGIGSRLAKMPGQPFCMPTSWGPVRGRLIEAEGLKIAAIARHAFGHKVPPHHVNYRAMAEGLHRLGARGCVASAAVGCLRRDWKIGDLAACDDMVDLTFRNITMHERRVQHQEISQAFPLYIQLVEAAETLGERIHPSAVYGGMNGPRYETPSEVKMLCRIGVDVVGMTASSEAVCMKEAGVPYACLAVVTNKAEGMSEGGTIDHEGVGDVMEERGEAVVRLMIEALRLAVK